MGRPSPQEAVGTVLGVIVFALVAESFGYGALSSVVIALAIGAYVIKSRSKTNRK